MNFQYTKKVLNTFKSTLVSQLRQQIEINQQQKRNEQVTEKPIHYKIDLKYMDGYMNQDRVNKLTLLKECQYTPSPYMAHSFLQSIYNITFSDNLKVNYRRELIRLQDGGQFSLDWTLPINQATQKEYEPSEDTKIMFIIHGLTGGSNMNYIKSMILYGQQHGYRCVAFNSRGINTELTTPVPFNGESLNDLDHALNIVRQRFPNAPIFGVGASYGSNMLLRWAGNKKEDNFLTAMAGLSTPFSIIECIQKIGYVYEGFFVHRYKANCIDPHKEILKQLEKTHDIDLNKLAKVKNLREFHEQISIKLFGYSSVDDYFKKSDIHPEQLLNISRPCLLMHSKDDPIVTYDCVPQDVLLQNPQIIQAETSHGAHVCWYTGLNPERWYPKPLVQFFETILEEQQEKRRNQN